MSFDSDSDSDPDPDYNRALPWVVGGTGNSLPVLRSNKRRAKKIEYEYAYAYEWGPPLRICRTCREMIDTDHDCPL